MLSRISRFSLAVSLIVSVMSSVSIPSAFAATVYTFTNAGASGQNGPTQAQVNSAYSSSALSGLVTINTQGIQEWTVPTSGDYWIEVAGASGGYTPSALGGSGRKIRIKAALTAGHLLKILVGQEGGRIYFTTGYAGGGGGGTFIYNATTSSYIAVAGGGGGAGEGNSSYVFTKPGIDAADYSSTAGTSGGAGAWGSPGAGGTNGTGGTAGSSGSAGAGISSSGSRGGYGGYAGNTFISGGIGGLNYAGTSATTNVEGGFGGGTGGGIYPSYEAVGGGGGGYSGGGGGGGRVSAGGGGGNYYTGTYVSSSTNTGNGFATIESVGPSLTTFSSTTNPTNSTTVTYNIAFSEAVTGLATSDFSKSGTGSSTCTIGTPSGSGTSYTLQLTGCSEGSVMLSMASGAVSNASAQSAPASTTAAATVIIDRTAPTISSVTAPSNATYKPSDTPTFLVNFSESVTVTGSPRLVLTVGSATEYSIYQSMVDSKTARFRYTVATDPNEFDTDGISINTTLDLNGGAIADLATNAIVDRTFSAPTLTSVLIAQPSAAPTIDSITATSGTLAIYFTAGAARGSTTTSYQYSSNNGAWTNRPTGTTASPITLTGLTNGTGYTIRLRAVTNAGNSDSSTAVTETPTAISVLGDTTLVITYGNSGSTSAYSATGGTGTYTWSLGSSISGVTLSGTTVSAANTLTAGTYSQTVRATDGNSQIGSRSLTITVNKAPTSVSIALPNSASSAALGGAVTITATVPRAGSVNFKLGGATISGCGAASASSTTATCTWTPGSLGSVSLTAEYAPTDASNYETSTSSTLSITVVNGVSSVNLQLAGGVLEVPKGQSINIIAAIDQAGKVSFYVDGKRLPGCFNKTFSAGNAICAWKPAIQKQVSIRVTLNPTNSVYNNSSSTLSVLVKRRSGLR